MKKHNPGPVGRRSPNICMPLARGGRLGRSGIVVLVLFLASTTCSRTLRAQVLPNAVLNPRAIFRPDRVLIKPTRNTRLDELAAIHSATGCRVIRTFPRIGNLQVLGLPAGAQLVDLLAVYRNSGRIQYAEPDYMLRAFVTPNDPRFSDGSLWALHNAGQSGGVADADVDAPEGWDVQSAASSVIVAVIDTGVRFTHEDLAASMWINPGESGVDALGLDKSRNGRDDDGNGYIDDVHGIHAIVGLGIGLPLDDNGHGTHVSGTIAAVGNNGTGVVGVAWRAQIMACKFLNALGTGFTSDAITCIDYARANGAKIINASWGGSENSASLRDAIDSVSRAGMLFVAAAGNESANNDVKPLYPASYDLDNIIAVAATDRRDQLAFFSNYGPTMVDLGAPGHEILSTWHLTDSAYTTFSGTSMAAPHVVGVCALTWTVYSGESYVQIKNRVLDGVDPLPSLRGRCVTGGRLNLAKALGSRSSTPSAPPVQSAPLVFNTVDGILNGLLGNTGRRAGGLLSLDAGHSQLRSAITNAPRLLTDQSSLRALSFGQFRFELQGDSNQIYVIEASTNLVDWTPVVTYPVSGIGSFKVADPAIGHFPLRFYRALVSPAATNVGSER